MTIRLPLPPEGRRCGSRGSQRARPKVRVRDAREDHVDPEPRPLLRREGLEVSEHGVLRGAVRRVQRQRAAPDEARHDHDVTVPPFLPPIASYELLRQVQQRREVDLHQTRQGLVEVGLQRRTALVLTGVQNQHVDSRRGVQRRRHGVVEPVPRAVHHVERDGRDPDVVSPLVYGIVLDGARRPAGFGCFICLAASR